MFEWLADYMPGRGPEVEYTGPVYDPSVGRQRERMFYGVGRPPTLSRETMLQRQRFLAQRLRDIEAERGPYGAADYMNELERILEEYETELGVFNK